MKKRQISWRENEIDNESCRAFLKSITEKELVMPQICASDGIGIIPSLKCNFSCKYCFEHNFEKAEMTAEMIPQIKKFVERWNQEMDSKVTVKSVGMLGGEIFRKETRMLVETIMQEFEDADYSITTNGVELIEFQDLICKYRPEMTVSLDGTEEMQAAKRQTTMADAYERILAGIRFLADEGMNITIATVYNPDFPPAEYGKFFDILEEFGWLHKENIKVNFSLEMERGIQGCEKEKQKEVLKAFRQLLLEEERARRVGRCVLPGIASISRVLKEKMEKGTVDLTRCSATISDGLIFAPDGFVYNCNYTMTEQNRIGQYYPEIKIYKNVVNNFCQRTIFTIPECKDCKMALFCRGGCPISAVTEHGSIKKGFCGIWKDEDILKDADLFIDANELYQMARQFEM